MKRIKSLLPYKTPNLTKWLEELPQQDHDEFAALKNTSRNELPASMIMDWIEERGGMRRWWRIITTEE